MKNHRPDAGFSLAALIFFAAAASILAAAAVPAYQMQAKREREKELMFRAAEYTRAIQKYQRKFGVYPSSIDQLVQTNGLRFLRRAYKDPITGKDFRLLRINPDGSISGSKLFSPNINNRPLFGNTQTFGQQPGQQPGGQQPPGVQAADLQQQPGGRQQGLQQSQFGQQQGLQQSQFGQQQGLQQPQFGQQQGLQQPQFGQQPSATPQQGQQPQQSLQSSAQSQMQAAPLRPFATIGNGGNSPISGGGVVGVASDSDETSVMVYNRRQKYSEWEFIAIAGQTGPQPGQSPQVPGQIPGGPTQANPQVPGTPTLAPQPGLTPFGPAPGTQPQQQPSGGGNPFGGNSLRPGNPFGSNPPGRMQ